MSNPMRFVDKDGKQIDFPPGFFGQPENIETSAIQQKVEPMMAEVARPAAISMSLGGSLAAGLAGGGSMSNTYFLKGQDQKTLNTYNTTEVGAGLPGGDISLGLSFTFLQGDSFRFNAQSIEGESVNETYSVGISGVVIGVTKSTVLTQDEVPVNYWY